MGIFGEEKKDELKDTKEDKPQAKENIPASSPKKEDAPKQKPTATTQPKVLTQNMGTNKYKRRLP